MVRSEKKVTEISHKKITNVLARKKIFNSFTNSRSGSETPQTSKITNLKKNKSFNDGSLQSSTPLPQFNSNRSKKKKNRNSLKERSIKDQSHNISKRRNRSGTVALREIRKFQKTTNLLIPRLPFMRIVQEVLQSYSTEPYRLQSAALEALQEMTEMLMIDLFSEALLCCLHAKRRTIMVPDMRLARRIRGRDDIIN